ncbi:MAG: M48 family metallopeptidase [Bacteroidales bacterium]|nr:M48 family metallopeptidase [Bacteroidales bacterium]
MKILILAGLISLTTLTKANNTLQVPLNKDTIAVKTEVFDPEIATQKYLDTLTPEEKEKSDAYFEGGYWLMLWNVILIIIITWVFLSLGLSRWIKGIAIKAKNINLQNLIYIFLYFLFAFLLIFPLNIYQGFFREHQYNLSNLSFGGWLGDELKILVLTLIFGSIILLAIYKVIRKVKQDWWIWASGIAFVFIVFGMFIGPVFITPIFNRYKPLEEGKLKNEILSLARANGVPAENVYQFDASKQSKRISANVSGFGNTIRISLNDNLLKRCSISEVRSVMAHEMGHYVLNHIHKGIILLIIVLVIAFALVNWCLNKSISRWGEKWNINNIDDIGSLPLLVLLFTLFFYFSKPIINNFSRTIEIEADYFSLNAAQEPDGFAYIAMKLSEYRKISPGHLEEIIFFDHPSGKTRVHNAMIWKAEHLNKPVNVKPQKE